MCWRNVIVTGSLDTGAVHEALLNSTRSGSDSANAPFVSTPGSDTLSVASPAVLMTLAVVFAVYSFATPGVNAPNVAGVPSVRLSVAGTLPPTPPGVSVWAYTVASPYGTSRAGPTRP